MLERDDLQTVNDTSSVVGSRQWRQVLRDVDEVVAGCRRMILAAPRCLIYSMDLEVRHLEYMPGCWCRETMANGRAWKRFATPESVVLIYKQNIIAQLLGKFASET